MLTLEPIPFEIVYYSSFEQGYKPESLAWPLQTNQRGWETQKNPAYPQDLILRLTSGRAIISKVEILSHHYMIASQIELYAGIGQEEQDDNVDVEFVRLGFVNLNNSSHFDERELKSIKIEANCEYIRLVVKGYHENSLNIHKQVGIVALNIFGYEPQQNDDITLVPSLASTPEFQQNNIPPHETEIQNTNVECDLGHWMQAILNAEQCAAEDENFEEAKSYKELGDKLLKLWEYLSDLERDKKQAVAIKDYDAAIEIKADLVQVRQEAKYLLKRYGIQIAADDDILPLDTIYYSSDFEQEYNENDVEQIAMAAGMANTTPPPSDEEDDDIANWTSFAALSVNGTDISKHVSTRISINLEESSAATSSATHIVPVDPETIPEPMSADDIEHCESAIQQFGKDLVEHIMSFKVKCRQNGLNQLDQLISRQQQQMMLHQAAYKPNKKFIHASILMIQEAVRDSRESIFHQAILTWEHMQDIIVKYISKDDLQMHAWLKKLFSTVLIRTSDNDLGIKQTATKTILGLIERDSRLVELCLGERMIRNMKDAKSRLDLVSIITKKALIPHQWSVDPSAYRENVMKFIVPYLNKHSHTDVHKYAWELLMAVAQDQQQKSAEDFKNMCLFLDNDTVELLERELHKLDNRKKMAASTSTSMQKALIKKSNDGRKTGEKSISSGTSASRKTKQQPQATAEEDEKTNICIFCDEVNDDFNEDTLITHYYNQCPVLTKCPLCQIILEVYALKDHVSSDDCPKKHLMTQCKQCEQSIPVEQWRKHSSKKPCPTANESHSTCPFCQFDMKNSTELQWKFHLINKCSKNPRKK